MSDLKACRICLTFDTKMFLIQGNSERRVTALFGPFMISSPSFPRYLCYECHGLLKKFDNFRDKAMVSQSTLCYLLQTHNEITEDILRVAEKPAKLESYLARNSKPNTIYHFTDSAQFDKEIKTEVEEVAPLLEVIVEVKEGGENLINEEAVDRGFVDDGDEKYSVSLPGSPLPLNKDEKFEDDDDSDNDETLLELKKKVNREESNKTIKEKNGHKVKSKTKFKDKIKKEKLKPKKTKTSKKSIKLETTNGEMRTRRRKRNDEDIIMNEFTVTKLSFEEQMAEMEERKSSSNYIDSPYKCELCYRGFLLEETFKNHNRRHDPSIGDVECQICKHRFKNARLYRKHALLHAVKYVCKSCNYVGVTIYEARNHKKWHEGVTYKCQYCDENFTKATTYFSHVRIKHSSVHVCVRCGYSFVSALGLKQHLTRAHHEDPEENKKDQDQESKPEKESPAPEARTERRETSLYCEECNLQFSSAEAWKRHTVTSANHKTDLGSSCRHCGETFPSAQHLRGHMSARHPRTARGAGRHSARHYPLPCEQCSEMIANPGRHWRHYQRHHRDARYPHASNNYICEVCGKGFQTNSFLQVHIRSHSAELPFACGACPKAFRARAALLKHAATHAPRAFPCAMCSKTFKTKLGLQQHTQSHTGEHPFSCEFCGKTFARAANKNTHVRLVH